jgi:hypothetical protein
MKAQQMKAKLAMVLYRWRILRIDNMITIEFKSKVEIVISLGILAKSKDAVHES